MQVVSNLILPWQSLRPIAIHVPYQIGMTVKGAKLAFGETVLVYALTKLQTKGTTLIEKYPTPLRIEVLL